MLSDTECELTRTIHLFTNSKSSKIDSLKFFCENMPRRIMYIVDAETDIGIALKIVTNL